ncbi:MAG: RAMP superfamily CRISPR-associated protein [Acidobacteriota bacterium]|nr:RAMP superfamily CRISPR-associated protein [Acidobacteriota bacterium]
MNWDYFLELGQNRSQQERLEAPAGLAAGRVDALTIKFCRGNREDARREYMDFAAGQYRLCECVTETFPRFDQLASSNWLAFEVEFELLTPWYSRDDRVFHVLDNPVRKDRVFGVPFMAASSWKGMLRWACRMQAGLRAHLESGKPFREWKDPAWILHLFGNVKGEEEFHRGALVFYPTWFDRIGFAVINPHSRERRAGTQPIYYEVVPPGAKGTLHLLYAPWPGMQPAADPKEFMPHLLQAIETLLTEYGISAKRTVGWGTAKITRWKAFRRGATPVEADSRDELCEQIQNWLRGGNVT